LGCEGIKSPRTPVSKKPDAFFDLRNDGFFQLFGEFPPAPACGQFPVAGKTAGLFSFWVISILTPPLC